MRNEHAGGAGAGPRGHYALRVVRCKEGSSLTVRLLEDVGPGCLTHWVKDRSVYCPGPKLCPASIHGGKWTWQTFTSALLWSGATRAWYPICLGVTEGLDHCFRGQAVRGTEWLIRRPKGKDKGSEPLQAVLRQQLDPEGLPPAFSIRAVLLSTFHVGDIALNVPNPLPPPELVEPVQLPGPIGDEGSKECPPAGPEEVKKLMEAFTKRFGANGRTAK